MFLKWLLSTRTAFPLFFIAVLITYGFVPWVIDTFVRADKHLAMLTHVTLVGCAAMWVGYKLPLFDRRFAPDAWRLSIDARVFHALLWTAFVIFALVTLATAPKIPLLSAIQGGSSVQELDQQRGAFLKMRQGYEAVLPYIATMFFSVLAPYSLVHLLLDRARLRFVAAAGFMLFTVSFLVKSLFLSVVLPIMYLFTRESRGAYVRFASVCAGSVVLMLVLMRLAANVPSQETLTAESIASGTVKPDQQSPIRPAPSSANSPAPAQTRSPDFSTHQVGAAIGERVDAVRKWAAAFSSIRYLPRSNIDYLAWRTFAIPAITAADTLAYHAEELGGRPLLGGTSLVLSILFQVPRFPLEKLVYARQFGLNEFASSNAVFLADAYANFLWAGVIVYSLFVGQSWRWFRLSHDQGFKALWPLYGFILFLSPLIGTLVSSGYALVFVFALFCQLKKPT